MEQPLVDVLRHVGTIIDMIHDQVTTLQHWERVLIIRCHRLELVRDTIKLELHKEEPKS